ncbi:MAG: response regulator [Xenococcaceae cyanobacterium MO_188.B32]|nr:response regulator [Xenococcaceae cyanobacterium MO_188.B32]
MRILLVDDDATLIDVLPRMLTKHNYAIDTATDGEQGWIYGSTYNYDLIILDWSLPKLDGISLCKRFRAHGCDTPILLLTARNTSQDKIRGLDAGADDYLCKPFDVEELAARIRALLRRLNCDFLSVLSWGELKLDSSNCEVTYQGELLSLTAKEYRLLELFLRHDREVLSIEDIIENLWSSAEYPAEATVRSHLRRLRQKLQLAGLPEDPIDTVRGRGYCLKPPPENNSLLDRAEQPKDRREKHIAALTTAWSKYRSKSHQQLITLDSAIAALKQGNIETSDRLSAIVTAHSLAGNLGLFGFDRGSRLARQLEQLLQGEQNPQQLWQLETTLQSLRQELTKESNFSQQISYQLEEHSPLILIVDDDSIFTEQLVQEANNLGIKTAIVPSPELAKIWLEEQPKNTLPNLVLLKISFADSTNPLSRWNRLSLIAEFKLIEPSIPVIVLADRDRFQDRLQVARHGGYFYLQHPITPLQTITFCQQVLRNFSLGKKVMIVDDDVELLRVLPSLLQPWGFQVTTLEDSRQFWDVLQAVNPNLLVLDIEMPYLSGIELCKVLRTHPYWCKLPVLFLSVHTDIAIREQVFATGADDFIYKPVVAKRLADRIINCLERRV